MEADWVAVAQQQISSVITASHHPLDNRFANTNTGRIIYMKEVFSHESCKMAVTMPTIPRHLSMDDLTTHDVRVTNQVFRTTVGLAGLLFHGLMKAQNP